MLIPEGLWRPEAKILTPRFAESEGALAARSQAEADTKNAVISARRASLDILCVPIFVLRSDSEILDCNEAGQELLRVSRAFRRLQNRLTIRRAADAAAMAEAVARVAKRGEPELIRFLTRQEEASALMRVQPVPGEPVVVASISELRAPLLLAPGWSRAAFGFSAQNAALAESLAIGHSLADFATAENLPIGTVRTRLKKLLQQTGMTSQASLAAMLLRASTLMNGAEILRSPPNGRK